jgi:predicted RNase H-like HicB family nuclease
LWHEDGEWFGRGLELPFCMGDGKTIAACVRVTRRSMALGVASILKNGEIAPVPELDLQRRSRRRAG